MSLIKIMNIEIIIFTIKRKLGVIRNLIVRWWSSGVSNDKLWIYIMHVALLYNKKNLANKIY